MEYYSWVDLYRVANFILDALQKRYQSNDIEANILFHIFLSRQHLTTIKELVSIGQLTIAIWIVISLLTILIFALLEAASIYQKQKQELAKWEGEIVKANIGVVPIR